MLIATPGNRATRSAGADGSLGAIAWRLLRTPPAPAAWNMACDHTLAEAVGRRQGPATLRLFGWDPPAISIGYNQPLRGLAGRLAELDRLGLDLVRRPTGGGAVLHAREVTYSVAAPLESPLLAQGPRAACARIHSAILAGLEGLGISGLALHAGPSESRPVLRQAGTAARPAPSVRVSTPVCFAAAGRSEISWRGRKLVGSAQRRLGRALLQHGSILLEGDQRPLEALWPGATRSGAVTLAEAGGRRFGWEELADAVTRGFENELGAAFRSGGLAPAELRRTEGLARDPYGCRDFLLRL